MAKKKIQVKKFLQKETVCGESSNKKHAYYPPKQMDCRMNLLWDQNLHHRIQHHKTWEFLILLIC
jgi:hypothetical protein